MSHPLLGRLPEFDDASRSYPVRALLGEPRALRGRSWACLPTLDQGQTSSCVGHAWAHELAALPVRVPVDSPLALALYGEAQRLDEYEGESYDGTSVLAGAKAVQARGFLAEYRWAFGIDDALDALSHIGPVVLGLNWTESMFEPHPSGLLEVSGAVVGGHALLARGLLLKTRLVGEARAEPVVRVRNSWGPSWGRGGDCFLRVSDLERLLADGGECCVPGLRSRGPAAP